MNENKSLGYSVILPQEVYDESVETARNLIELINNK